MNFVKQIAMAATLVGATLSASAAPTNLVANGDFENWYSAWDFQGSSFLDTASNWGYSGTSVIAMGGGSNIDVITQTISTVANRSYTFSFDYGSSGDDSPHSMAAVFDGQTVFSIPGNAPYSDLANKSFTVTASSASTVVEFHLQDASAVDNVSVTSAVPEPTTLALMAMGLAGLALRRARKV